VIYTIAPLFESRPNYSTSPSNEYRYKATTSKFNVEFYVNQQYFEEAKNQDYKRRAEMMIDREYLSQIEKSCDYSKRQKKKLEDYAYRESAGARRDEILRQARLVDMMNCRLLYNLRNEHEDYVRDLTYMR